MYERFYGLVDAPFRLTPDPRYLFLSKKHAEALAHLRLGLKESSGFVCISGDVGTGKTTLLRAFLADLGPDVSTAYIFTPPGDGLELIQRINRELGLPETTGSQMEQTEALHEHLLAQRKAGKLCVVVVDEAQAFSIELLEELRLLSNLETATEKLLRVVLVGQPQLRDLLGNPALAQLNQRITLRWHMGPLAYHEMAGYVRHRLGVASRGKVTHLFTAPALRVLYRLSGGVPRLVNMISHRALLAAFVARKRRVTSRSVLRAYREIGAVPLPGTPGRTRRIAWAATIAAVAVGVGTIGAPRFGWLTTPPAPANVAQKPAPRAPAPPPPAPVPEPAAALAPAPAEDAAAPAAVARAATADAAAPAGALATAGADLEARLATLGAQASGRQAVADVFAAWHVRPLANDETNLPTNLERFAWRRSLDTIPLNGNRSMLQLLDLPAVVELRGGTDGTVYAALLGIDGDRIALAVDGRPVTIDAASLDRFWFGQAWIVWRDFDGLGPTFGKEASGTPVMRLQALLHRAGLYTGPTNGAWDDATQSAVLGFQRSRRLDADGRVGRLTRIVLYAAAGGYARPTLAPGGGGAS